MRDLLRLLHYALSIVVAVLCDPVSCPPMFWFWDWHYRWPTDRQIDQRVRMYSKGATERVKSVSLRREGGRASPLLLLLCLVILGQTTQSLAVVSY